MFAILATNGLPPQNLKSVCHSKQTQVCSHFVSKMDFKPSFAGLQNESICFRFRSTVISSLTPGMWLWVKSAEERLTVSVMAALGLPTTPSYYKISILHPKTLHRKLTQGADTTTDTRSRKEILNDKRLHFKLLLTLRQNNDEVLLVGTTRNGTDLEGVINCSAYLTSLASAKRKPIISNKIKR